MGLDAVLRSPSGGAPSIDRIVLLACILAGAAACGATESASGDAAVAAGATDASASSPDVTSTTPSAGTDGASAEATPPPTADAAPEDAELLGDGGGPRSFTIANRCTQTVWAAALPATTFPNGLVEMAPGFSFRVGVGDGWSGRVWGKTACTTSPSGKSKCASDAFPSSLAELTLTTTSTGLDFYDVSLVDGFNLPIELSALGHVPDAGHPYDCGAPSCAVDLNASCPAVLQDSADGAVIACANDECRVLGGNDASSAVCTYPNQYTEFFKTACPTAYSYPSDDATSTFTCRGQNDYAVVFCP
ncbi:MAG TPA: thaumatin family protein [Polyangiaceae bacterium]|jgi:hypothetical protein